MVGVGGRWRLGGVWVGKYWNLILRLEICKRLGREQQIPFDWEPISILTRAKGA